MEKETNLLDARSDPDIVAILERFPGAKIMDVRVRKEEAEDEENQTGTSRGRHRRGRRSARRRRGILNSYNNIRSWLCATSWA